MDCLRIERAIPPRPNRVVRGRGCVLGRLEFKIDRMPTRVTLHYAYIIYPVLLEGRQTNRDIGLNTNTSKKMQTAAMVSLLKRIEL